MVYKLIYLVMLLLCFICGCSKAEKSESSSENYVGVSSEVSIVNGLHQDKSLVNSSNIQSETDEDNLSSENSENTVTTIEKTSSISDNYIKEKLKKDNVSKKIDVTANVDLSTEVKNEDNKSDEETHNKDIKENASSENVSEEQNDYSKEVA